MQRVPGARAWRVDCLASCQAHTEPHVFGVRPYAADVQVARIGWNCTHRRIGSNAGARPGATEPEPQSFVLKQTQRPAGIFAIKRRGVADASPRRVLSAMEWLQCGSDGASPSNQNTTCSVVLRGNPERFPGSHGGSPSRREPMEGRAPARPPLRYPDRWVRLTRRFALQKGINSQ